KSASQRKGKGKATGKRKRGDSSQSIIALMYDSSWREKNFTQQEKADQLLPANDPTKFANRYCELKYPAFANSRNLYLERTLKIPEALQQYTTEQIKQRGWFFLERTLTERTFSGSQPSPINLMVIQRLRRTCVRCSLIGMP
ncbi:hypothetical protein HN51_051684, partial [Arachis hypogaea]